MQSWLRFLAVVALGAVRGLPLPTSSRRRRRALVCTAAQLLTALGVRVEVHPPAVAWPRGGAGRLVVSNRVGRLGDLALLTVVPGTPVAAGEVAHGPVIGRLLRRADAIVLDRARLRALPGAVAEVAQRLRGGVTVLAHPEGAGRARLDRFRPAPFQAAVDAAAPVCPVAIRYRSGVDGVVVEVHLLPALAPDRADRRTLAALAEYAVAEVLEARSPEQRRRPEAVIAAAH